MKSYQKSQIIFIILVLIVLALLYFALRSTPWSQPTGNPPPQQPSSSYERLKTGHRNKTDYCVIKDSLPDKDCTPGNIFSDATKEKICTLGYARSVRHVSGQVKHDVYEEYGIESHQTGEYEVDHLVSLELGGSNDISNLWPEPAEPKPGFHEKDKVENYLHEEVCSGRMSLQDAQTKIASDWTNVFRQIGYMIFSRYVWS